MVLLSLQGRSFALSLALLGVACGEPAPAAGAKYPAKPPGCDVAIFPDAPAKPTDNIGPVVASCGGDTSKEDCLRTLKDQACKLGGDVIWGVNEPEIKDGKMRLSGRAAHTK
jgi:hypothetical protein